MKKLLFALFMILFLSAGLSPSAFSQCAMCKAVAKSNMDSKQNEVGKGINRGVIYLLVTPYLLVGAGAFYIYKKRRKNVDTATN